MIDLREVKKQTPEICLAAVKQDGLALEHVKEKTPEICLTAVKENEAALQCVFPCFEEAVSQTLERQCLH